MEVRVHGLSLVLGSALRRGRINRAPKRLASIASARTINPVRPEFLSKSVSFHSFERHQVITGKLAGELLCGKRQLCLHSETIRWYYWADSESRLLSLRPDPAKNYLLVTGFPSGRTEVR
jgi:hypothetical protein